MTTPTDYSVLASALGNPPPPPTVTQQQFDGNQAALERLARCTTTACNMDDLTEYAMDLEYVDDLQPDLLRFLMPLCFKAWQDYLETGSGQFQSFVQRFHAALAASNRWAAVLGEHEKIAVLSFCRSALVGYIERQTDVECRGYKIPDATTWPAYRWISYLASYGTFSPQVPELWTEWWSFKTPGAVIAALQYVSCLIYPDDANPIFKQTKNTGGGPPTLWDYESLGHEECWLPSNVEFLQNTLSLSYLKDRLQAGISCLSDAQEASIGRTILSDLDGQSTEVKERIAVLPMMFSTPGSRGLRRWI